MGMGMGTYRAVIRMLNNVPVCVIHMLVLLLYSSDASPLVD